MVVAKGKRSAPPETTAGCTDGVLGYQMRGVGSTLVTYAISARGSTCVRDKIKGIPFNQGASLGGRNEYPNARRELTAPRSPFPHQGPLNSPDPPMVKISVLLIPQIE